MVHTCGLSPHNPATEKTDSHPDTNVSSSTRVRPWEWEKSCLGWPFSSNICTSPYLQSATRHWVESNPSTQQPMEYSACCFVLACLKSPNIAEMGTSLQAITAANSRCHILLFHFLLQQASDDGEKKQRIANQETIETAVFIPPPGSNENTHGTTAMV